MDIRISLREDELITLFHGGEVLRHWLSADEDNEVHIILQNIGFGRMHRLLGEAMVASAEDTGPASVQAYEEGNVAVLVVDRLIHVDEEAPITTRVPPDVNAALTVALEHIVVNPMTKNAESPGFWPMAAALYAFQLGHDYALQFGDITLKEARGRVYDRLGGRYQHHRL